MAPGRDSGRIPKASGTSRALRAHPGGPGRALPSALPSAKMAALARGSREAGGAGRGARALMAAGRPLTAGPGGHGAHQHPQGNPSARASGPLPAAAAASSPPPQNGPGGCGWRGAAAIPRCWWLRRFVGRGFRWWAGPEGVWG